MLDEIKRKFEEQYSTPAGDMLFVIYIKQWLEKKKPLIQMSTWEGYEIYVTRHIVPYFEPLKLSLRDIRPQHIKDYYEFKYTKGRLDGKEGGLSIASIKKHALVIKEALTDALVGEYITRNPAEGVKLPAKETTTREKVFLDAEQANLMLKAFKGHPLQALVYVRHSSVEMTGDIYTHITEARKARMAAQLNSTFDLGGANERPEED